jgi:serine/threonine-protein kinase
VLYEMLAGQPPFTGTTSQSIRARHAIDPVPSLRSVRSTVTRALESVIQRALSKVPADRFASAEEFAAALKSGHAIPAAGRRPSKLLLGGAATAAVGLMLLAIVRGSVNSTPKPASTGTIKSLAVQPFTNLTGDTAQIYLAKGLTEQLVTSLAQLNALRVINLRDTKEVTVQHGSHHGPAQLGHHQSSPLGPGL